MRRLGEAMGGYGHVNLARLVRRLMYLTGKDPEDVERWFTSDVRPSSSRQPVLWTRYGEVLRTLAERLGVEKRALQLYTADEVRTLLESVADRIRSESEKNPARANANTWYPNDWQRSMPAEKAEEDAA